MFITSPILNSISFTDWQPVDYRQRPMDVQFRIIFTPTTTLTYNVEYTLDDPNAPPQYFSALSQTTTVITGTTFAAHNLNVGDSVRISQSGTAMDGLYNIATVPSTTTFTVTSGTSASRTGSITSAFVPCRVTVLSGFSAKTAISDSSVAGVIGPVRALRLNVTAYTGGSALMEILQGPSSA